MSIDASITMDSVIVEHQTSSGPVRALNGVSLTVDAGSSVAITGPSGGGKSTLLGVIGGLARPTWGSVRIGDAEISELSERDRSDFRRSQIGFVYQADNLLPFLTLLENVGLQLSLNGKSSGTGTIAGGARRTRPRWPGLPAPRPPLGRAAATGCGGPGESCTNPRSFSPTSRPVRWIRPMPPASSTYCWPCSARSARR